MGGGGSGGGAYVLVGLWDWFVGNVTRFAGDSLARSNPALSSYSGVYGFVDYRSWVTCFNCHFVGTSPLVLAESYNGTGSTSPPTSYIQHPDVCQPCHGVPRNTTDLGRTVWAHNIYGYKLSGADAVWGNCAVCHSAIASMVSSSVHSGVGCKCHSVVHLGYSYQGSWAAALFTFEGSTAGSPPPLTSAKALFRLQRVYTPQNYSGGVAQLIDAVLQKTLGRNIEVGLWDAYKNDYVSTLPLGIGPDAVWATCFNCHYLTIDPSKVSNPHAIGVKMSAPTWTSAQSASLSSETAPGRGGSTLWSAALVLVLLLGGFVIIRKRPI